MTLIEPAALAARVRQVAAGNPTGTAHTEYVSWDGDDYDSCCLLGEALVREGVNPLELTVDVTVQYLTGVVAGAVVDLIPEDRLPRELRWLVNVQQLQDAGHPWAYAVEEADNRDRQEQWRQHVRFRPHEPFQPTGVGR